MSTEDDSFRATDSGLFGFLADADDDDVPFKPFGVVGNGFMTGVLGFSGEAHPEGPIQQNSYSFHAGVEGGSVQFTGVAGVSLNRVGVYGQVEDAPQVPTGLLAGVLGAATTQPGVIGFSREGDGIEAASFTGTALRAVSFFGPGIDSLSGALTGVTGTSGTRTSVPNTIDPVAGVVGTSGEHIGVLGTSTIEAGVAGFSKGAVGVYGETGATDGYAGFFRGNLFVSGRIDAGVKDAIVPFPDGSQRVLHCMESPEHWFEDFGTAKLKRGRTVVRRVIAAGSMYAARARALRCASSGTARRMSHSPIVSSAGAETSCAIGVSPRSTRACPCRRRQRGRREHAGRARRRCAHSSPASSRRRANARRSARGKSEDRAPQSAGRSVRPGARRSDSAKALGVQVPDKLLALADEVIE